MRKNTVTRFKWFWAWQDDKEEAWLAEMSRRGLHLDSVSPFGLYHFRTGEPGEYIYRLDFQSLKAKDRDSYLQLFEDAGWEHIGDMGGWVYFRHQVDGTKFLEIYSDRESKIGKYQRVITILVVLLPIMILVLPDAGKLSSLGAVPVTIIETISAALLLLYSYAMVRLFLRINQLKR
jgi:hypothetical protein